MSEEDIGYKNPGLVMKSGIFLWWADMCYFTYTFWLPMM